VAKPPGPDDATRPEIRPNTLSTPARRGSAGVANRLSGALDDAGRARLPGVSGVWSAIALLVLFVAAAVVLPLALHRSAWVEAEIVVGAWFVIWTAVLAWLGYTGRTVEQDWEPFRPRRLFGRGGGPIDANTVPVFDVPTFDAGDLSIPDVGGGDGSGLGCLGAIAAGFIAVAVVGALLALFYFTIGYVIPLVAVGLYTLVRAMLNHVAARGHVTRGDLGRSLARGATWAAVYTAPLAVAIWLLHVAF
jgi:hypothetical protein